jgi:hypothetical protein
MAPYTTTRAALAKILKSEVNTQQTQSLHEHVLVPCPLASSEHAARNMRVTSSYSLGAFSFLVFATICTKKNRKQTCSFAINNPRVQ